MSTTKRYLSYPAAAAGISRASSGSAWGTGNSYSEVSSANGYTTGGGAVGTRTVTVTTTKVCKITGAFGGGAVGTTTY